jgi:hypothetical protein
MPETYRVTYREHPQVPEEEHAEVEDYEEAMGIARKLLKKLKDQWNDPSVFVNGLDVTRMLESDGHRKGDERP